MKLAAFFMLWPHQPLPADVIEPQLTPDNSCQARRFENNKEAFTGLVGKKALFSSLETMCFMQIRKLHCFTENTDVEGII